MELLIFVVLIGYLILFCNETEITKKNIFTETGTKCCSQHPLFLVVFWNKFYDFVVDIMMKAEGHNTKFELIANRMK